MQVAGPSRATVATTAAGSSLVEAAAEDNKPVATCIVVTEP